METDQNYSRASSLSAKDSLKPINFYFAAPTAESVEIAGDFNSWQPHPMQRTLDGWWFVRMQLCHGHHHYHFIVDGNPQLDPQAMGVAFDAQQGRVSLVAVS
jgi:1,4-alpha-glucan branching enzyme